MVMPRFTWEEMMLLRMIELNSLMPHYWSELMLLAFQMFDPTSPEYAFLQEAVRGVEEMVFDDEEIRMGKSLYDIEMAIESNPDYYAFFLKEDGEMVTKFDIERELNKIKMWIYSKVRERAVGRKFQRFR